MAVLLYHMFAFSALFCYGIYHLVSATRSHHKASSSTSSPHRYEYQARPYHPLPLSPHRHHLLRHLPIYLAILSLLIAAGHQALSSSSPDPLLRGRTPVHRFTALQSAACLALFLLLSLSLLLSHSLPHLLPLPNDLLFLLAALAFALISSVSSHAAASYQTSDLQSKCDAISSLVSAASAALSLSLAFLPRLFVAELALAGSVSLQGLWSLQTGLSLYVEGFIPDGCHRLLDVPGGIEGSTRCDLEETRLRAAALLDLAFVMHVTFVAVVAVVVYAATARAVGLVRRHGSYEALPNSSSSGTLSDLDHVQMKQMTKTNMQA